jgi:hypothetical protein
MIYTLYVKIHRKTGLRYLGQTSQDPFKYSGSGVDWSAHLKKNGNDVETLILLQTPSKDERNYWGSHYSTLWNVVSASDDFGNKIWANRIPETGAGCDTKPKSIEHKNNIAASLRGRKKTTEHITNSKAARGEYKTVPILVNGIRFESVNAAAAEYGVKHSTLCNRLAGRKKPSKRFWEVKYIV